MVATTATRAHDDCGVGEKNGRRGQQPKPVNRGEGRGGRTAAHPRCRGTLARFGGAAVEEEVEDGAGDEDEAAGQHRGEVASVIRRRHAVGEARSRSRTRGRRRGAMMSGDDRRRRGCKASGAAVATDGIRAGEGERGG